MTTEEFKKISQIIGFSIVIVALVGFWKSNQKAAEEQEKQKAAAMQVAQKAPVLIQKEGKVNE